MRVAVYTIALNEEQFVKRWAESAKEADYLLIADTGSIDKTVELAESLGVNVVRVGIKPWRFDDARNAALAAIPLDIDYCIALDMDEVLIPGWRQALESVTPGTTRPRYKYTWSWNADGSPGLQYGGDKIHTRQGYRWKHPVHEAALPYGIEETQDWIGLEIHHHPDNSKSRSQYFPLLEMSVIEDPYNDRNAFYYARELMFYGHLDKAATEFKRHLELPTAVWSPERAASYRYLAKCDPENAEYWLKKACQESYRRENFVALASYYYGIRDWNNCLTSSLKALEIIDKPLDYLCDADAWGWLPHDLAALSFYNLLDPVNAAKYGEAALAISPNDDRLKSNLEYYKQAQVV